MNSYSRGSKDSFEILNVTIYYLFVAVSEVSICDICQIQIARWLTKKYNYMQQLHDTAGSVINSNYIHYYSNM